MLTVLLCTMLMGDGAQPPYTVDQPPPPPVFGPCDFAGQSDNYRDEGFHVLVGGLLSMSSDSAFPRFVGPMTNPWLAKDPPALSEARPLGVYTLLPGGPPL